MVLLNLVKNSAAAIDSRGQFLGDGLIVIRSQRIRMESAPSLGAGYGEVEAISIVVEDNGCGIPAHQLDKVGEFGFSTKGENGTGIGLANVSRFAEEHGGKFYIRSSEGKGTQVEIQIPLKDEARVDHVIVVADQPDIAREARAEEWKVLALSPASFEQVRLTSSGGILILDSMDDRLIDVASKKFSECPRPSLWRVLRVVDDTSLAIEGWAHLGIPMADLHRRHTALELKLAIRNLLDLGKFNTVMDATMEPS